MKGKKGYKKWIKVDDKLMFDHLPYILFLTLLGVIYITNSYYVEGTVRDMERLNKKISAVKTEFVQTKTELSLKGQRKDIVEKVKEMGIGEPQRPPYSLKDSE